MIWTKLINDDVKYWKIIGVPGNGHSNNPFWHCNRVPSARME